MTKTLKVSEDTYWKLKAVAVEKRVPMSALVESLVDHAVEPVPEKIPAGGWREPAAGTAPESRPSKPPPRKAKVGPATTDPGLQARIDAAIARSAAIPPKAPLDLKDPRTGMSAKAQAKQLHPDDDDVEF